MTTHRLRVALITAYSLLIFWMALVASDPRKKRAAG